MNKNFFIYVLIIINMIVSYTIMDKIDTYIYTLCMVSMIIHIILLNIEKSKRSTMVNVVMNCGAVVAIMYLLYRYGFTLKTGISVLFLTITIKLQNMDKKTDLNLAYVLSLFMIFISLLMKNSNLSLSTPFTLVIYTACIPFILIFPFLVNNHAISFNIKDGLTLIATSIIIYISLPHEDHYGYTPAMNDSISGVASTLTIGETDELKENKSPAFYARFNGDRPPSYYWKVKILSAYDGNAWSQILLPSAPSSKTDKITGNIYNYSIATESNYNSGYIALENTILVDNNLLVNKNGIIYSSNEDIKNFYNATAVSVVQNIETNIKYYLSLPLNSHPKTKAIAQSLVDENDSTEIKVKKLLYYFKQQKFKYTLSPGKINDADKIDYFMTTSKKGFCQFYASAFAVMARSVGIPTRIIMGFQGGELSDDDNVLTVKYSDAHAWDEVYVDGHGWVRVDPTSYTDPLYNNHSFKEDLFSFIESKMLVFLSIKKQYMFNKQYIPFNIIISSLISCFLLFISIYVIRKLKSWDMVELKMNKHGFNSLNYTHIPNRIWIHQYEYERYNLNKETPSFKLTYMTFNGCLLKKRNNKI